MPVTHSGRKVLPLDRQVQLAIGTFILVGVLLGFFVNPAYFLLSGFIGVGLIMAGLSGFCGMARIMALMPWNRSPPRQPTSHHNMWRCHGLGLVGIHREWMMAAAR